MMTPIEYNLPREYVQENWELYLLIMRLLKQPSFRAEFYRVYGASEHLPEVEISVNEPRNRRNYYLRHGTREFLRWGVACEYQNLVPQSKHQYQTNLIGFSGEGNSPLEALEDALFRHNLNLANVLEAV